MTDTVEITSNEVEPQNEGQNSVNFEKSFRDKLTDKYREIQNADKEGGADHESSKEGDGKEIAKEFKTNKTEKEQTGTEKTDTEQRKPEVEGSDKDDPKDDAKGDKPKTKKEGLKRSFSEDEQKAFDKMTKAQRALFEKREKDLYSEWNGLNAEYKKKEKEYEKLTEKTQKLVEKEKALTPFLKEVQQLTNEANALFKGAGKDITLTPSRYLQGMIEAQRMQRNDPVGYLKMFAEETGIDLKALAEGENELAFDSDSNKNIQEIANLQAKLESQEHKFNQLLEYVQNQQVNSKELEIQAIYDQVTSDLTEQEITEIAPYVESAVLDLRRQNPNLTDHELISRAITKLKYLLPRFREVKATGVDRINAASTAAISPKSQYGDKQVDTRGMTMREKMEYLVKTIQK